MGNDDQIFEYLVQMGAMRPEQDELKRKQAVVDILRQGVMNAPQGQMIGKHYVAPGLAGLASQLGQAYFAKQGQTSVDQGLAGLNAKQRQMLEELRRRKMGMSSNNMPIVYGTSEGE